MQPAIIGAIAGDVIGSVYEGRNVKSTDFPLFSPASGPTDDSVLTLALADALLHGRDIAASFRRYYALYPHAGYGAMFHDWAMSPGMGPYGSFGNGSAMRVSPVAWAFDDETAVLDAARDSAAVSHDHPEGIKGAQAIALAAFLARKGTGKDGILEPVAARTGYDLGFSLDEIRPRYRFDATCQGSVPQALVAFREGRDFEDTIRRAVSIGGDSDTIACMAGAVAGAHFGVPGEIDAETRARLDERLNGVLAAFEARFA